MVLDGSLRVERPHMARLLDDCLERLNLILLIPHGRSGSMLMQSLFDGHEQVISFPYWFKSYSWNARPSSTPRDLVEAFCGQPSLFGGEALPMGDTFRKGPGREVPAAIDMPRFKAAMQEYLESADRVTDKVVFVCAHLALARVLERDPQKLKYILLHVHKSRDLSIPAVRADFPDLYFMAMQRDPREDWASYVQALGYEYGEQDLLNKLMVFIERRLVDWHEPFLPLYRTLPAGRTKIIDLHRLHRLQDEAMRELASWLGLDWSPTLTQSTFLGHPWGGNSFLGTPIHGFSREKAEHTWKRIVSRRDVGVIDYLFYPILGALRYERPDVRPSRRATRRRILFSKPSIFRPRSGSPYVTERKRATPRFEREWALAQQGRAVGLFFRIVKRLPKDTAREAFLVWDRVAFVRVGLRELRSRYSARKFRMLEAIGNSYRDVSFAERDFV